MTGLLRGALAGAAGTTALNAATYLDMAVRGRGASDSPEQVIERSADAAGVSIPGKGEEYDNRLAGLGPLGGTFVGVAVGSVAGRIHHAFAERGREIPAPVEILLITAAAMALTDAPMKVLGISDPLQWSGKDWAGDVIPHLVYGAVTYATIKATVKETA